MFNNRKFLTKEILRMSDEINHSTTKEELLIMNLSKLQQFYRETKENYVNFLDALKLLNVVEKADFRKGKK